MGTEQNISQAITAPEAGSTYRHRFTFEGLTFYADETAITSRAARIYDGRTLMLMGPPENLRAPGVHTPPFEGAYGRAVCPEMEETSSGTGVSDADRLLAKVDLPRMIAADADAVPRADDEDLPLLGFSNTVEVEGGNRTDAGFMRLVSGFEFRGFVIAEGEEPSEYGEETVVIDDATGLPVMVDGKPVKRKMQKVYHLKGTGRQPSSDLSGGMMECTGKIKVPVYERLKGPIAELLRDENRLTAEARKKNPLAPRVKIPVAIRYRGKEPNRKAKIEGQPGRSGAHLFEVVQIAQVK